jgi:hypothetical protein
MKRSRWVFRTGTAFAVLLTVVFAQSSPVSPERASPPEPCGRSNDQLTPEAAAAWTIRFDEIEKEIAELDDHPWAGAYSILGAPNGSGALTSTLVTLAPRSGFAFVDRGCMGVYDRDFGAVIPTERGSLKLDFTYGSGERFYRHFEEEFVPISWGDRHYLIPFDVAIRFCNAINFQDDPHRSMRGFYYLRTGDRDKPFDGLPVLPEGYQAYLLGKTVLAEVVAVQPTMVETIRGVSVHRTVVTLNVGRTANVVPGMAFHVYEPSNIQSLREARVLSSTEKTCDVLVTQQVDEKTTTTLPTLGWKLTTDPRARHSGE